ncbi:hypothetical protein ACIQAC_35135 [Streptomyces sp. NPDC088387]|uniref:hypothetical protein n=1 Tax=Streptomyces sp. NPDC088387 TaxID=3365859 RepID=UPI0037F77969
MAETLSRKLRASVTAMARRESAVLLLSAPSESMTLVAVEPCPTCGADEATMRGTPGAVPASVAMVVSGRPSPLLGVPTLTVHGCELLTPRSLLAPAVLLHEDGLPVPFVSRSVAWAAASGSASVTDGDLESVLAQADRREAVLDYCLRAPAERTPRIEGPRRPMVLPCSTRLNPAALGLHQRTVPQSRFLTPHIDGPLAVQLDTLYRSVLVDAVAVAL